MTDEAYAPTVLKFEREGITPLGHWFLFGAGLALWSTWQVSTGLGIFLGSAIPPNWPLDFALPLTFIAMVIPTLKSYPTIGVVLSAGLVALLANGLPYKLGLILAALTGIFIGTMLEGRR